MIDSGNNISNNIQPINSETISYDSFVNRIDPAHNMSDRERSEEFTKAKHAMHLFECEQDPSLMTPNDAKEIKNMKKKFRNFELKRHFLKDTLCTYGGLGALLFSSVHLLLSLQKQEAINLQKLIVRRFLLLLNFEKEDFQIQLSKV